MNEYFDESLIDELEQLAIDADAMGDYETANQALIKIEEIANEARRKALSGR